MRTLFSNFAFCRLATLLKIKNLPIFRHSQRLFQHVGNIFIPSKL